MSNGLNEKSNANLNFSFLKLKFFKILMDRIFILCKHFLHFLGHDMISNNKGFFYSRIEKSL